MERLGDLLTSGRTHSATMFRDAPLGECERCDMLLDDGPPEAHCCRCRDGRRVSVQVGVRQFEYRPCDCANEQIRPAFDHRRHGIPAHLARATLATWEPTNGLPRQVALAYAQSPTWPPVRPLLTLHGEPGRGKSHLAAGIIREAYECHRVDGRFVEVPALIDRLRATHGEAATESVEDVQRWLERVPLLVLDDLGKQRGTDFVSERLYRVINARYGAELPTVVTCNPAEWAGLDPAVLSRLSDARLGQQVQCDGPDRRPMANRRT